MSTIDTKLFSLLQANIDEDTAAKDEIRDVLQKLERAGRTSQSVLSRAHSTPPDQLQQVLATAEHAIQEEIGSFHDLAEIAKKHPYYKYNNIWTRDVQNTIFSLLWLVWLGGRANDQMSSQQGQLLTIDQVASILKVEANQRENDVFHITIEEYLQALISLIEELARFAMNSVTLGDYQRPLQISQFVKDLHAGFQILNLKNDSLRRRSDSIKYNVKKVEDIVYDLSLRNLIQAPNAQNAS
ncbi:Translin [Xylogone sp. PMI_703]|nr:Translin [Xylogone sp. PMI_703]